MITRLWACMNCIYPPTLHSMCILNACFASHSGGFFLFQCICLSAWYFLEVLYSSDNCNWTKTRTSRWLSSYIYLLYIDNDFEICVLGDLRCLYHEWSWSFERILLHVRDAVFCRDVKNSAVWSKISWTFRIYVVQHTACFREILWCKIYSDTLLFPFLRSQLLVLCVCKI